MKIQKLNQEWWTQNPMTYDWDKTMAIKPNSKEFFQEIDKRFFDALIPFAHLYNSKIPFENLIPYKILTGKKVLEIGCGAGSLASVFSTLGADYTGVDISDTEVKLTKKRFKVFKLKGKIIQADAEKLPFKNNTFDFVWSWGVIHHSAYPERIVSEIYRVLKPNGETRVMVYNKNSLRYWLIGGLWKGILRGRLLTESLENINKSFTDGYYAKQYTQRELRDLFKDFEVLEIKVLDQCGNSQTTNIFRRIMLAIPRFLQEAINKAIFSRVGWFLFIVVRKK